MKNNKEEKKKEEEKYQKKELDYDYCPKHKMRYPKGSSCPKCDQEKEKQLSWVCFFNEDK